MFFPANGRQKKAAFGTDTQLFPRGGKEFGGEEQSGGSEGGEDTDVESDAAHVTSMLAQPQPTHAMRSREHAERRHHRRRPSPSTQIVPKKLLDCPIQIISKTAPRCFFVEMKTPTTGQATKKKKIFSFLSPMPREVGLRSPRRDFLPRRGVSFLLFDIHRPSVAPAR